MKLSLKQVRSLLRIFFFFFYDHFIDAPHYYQHNKTFSIVEMNSFKYKTESWTHKWIMLVEASYLAVVAVRDQPEEMSHFATIIQPRKDTVGSEEHCACKFYLSFNVTILTEAPPKPHQPTGEQAIYPVGVEGRRNLTSKISSICLW